MRTKSVSGPFPARVCWLAVVAWRDRDAAPGGVALRGRGRWLTRSALSKPLGLRSDPGTLWDGDGGNGHVGGHGQYHVFTPGGVVVITVDV
jgi:hypothetical protein